MRDLYERCYPRIGAAREAGMPIYAGTDAGSMVAHGRIADEIEALKGIGMSPTEALGAASGPPVSGWDGPVWSTGPAPTWSAMSTIRARAPRCSTIRTRVILRGRVF